MKRSWRELKQQKKEWKRLKLEKEMKKFEEEKAEEEKLNNCDNEEPKGRLWTASIALPNSIVDNAQSMQLKTYLCGQIARAAAIFNIDEIIIFDEYARITDDNEDSYAFNNRKLSLAQMAKILQYLECPQYLRKYLFPIQKDLEFAGLLNPLDTFHHLKINDICNYREGVVIKKTLKEGKGSFVSIGLNKDIQIDKCLSPNTRVTVKFDAENFDKIKKPKGIAVSPFAPRTEAGLYWGYNLRIAKSLSAVFNESPFQGGYDLTIGTSERGSNIDKTLKRIPKQFNHLLIVFGGLKGLEASLESDESLSNVNDPKDLFDYYLNTCPDQGSNTIRTEEAILISLSALRKRLLRRKL